MVQEAEEEFPASQVTPNRPDLPEDSHPGLQDPRGPARVPAPAQPQPEDDAAGDCHQLRLPLRSIDLASGFVYSNSWTGGILIRGGFGLGRVCLLGFFK